MDVNVSLILEIAALWFVAVGIGITSRTQPTAHGLGSCIIAAGLLFASIAMAVSGNGVVPIK